MNSTKLPTKTENSPLNNTIHALKNRPRPEKKQTRDSALFQTILRAIEEKKGSETVSLDLREIEVAVADFFIISQGSSRTQLQSIADFVEEQVREQCQEKPYHVENGDAWILIDYIDIVVHIFDPQHRSFYDLESLWADAEKRTH